MLWILGHYELPLLLEYVTSPEQCVVVGKQNPLNESVDHLIQGLWVKVYSSGAHDFHIRRIYLVHWFDALYKNRVVVWEEKAMRLPSTGFLPVYMFLLSSGTRQNLKKNPPFRVRLDWFTSYLCQEWRWASSVLSVTHLDLYGYLLLLGEASEAPTGSAPVSRSQ